MSTMPLTVSERTFQNAVIELARYHGWLVAHFRVARTGSGGWATPMQGDVGFPDLVLSRAGEIIIAELKTQQGRASPAQKLWLRNLGAYGRLWKPSDWTTIMDELR